MSMRVTYAFMSSVVIVESAICGVGFVASAVKLETKIIIDVPVTVLGDRDDSNGSAMMIYRGDGMHYDSCH